VKPGTPEQRLEAVERELRRYRRQSRFVLVGLAVMLGIAAAIIAMAERGRLLDRSHDLVESKRFLLRDESGRIRGLFLGEAAILGAAAHDHAAMKAGGEGQDRRIRLLDQPVDLGGRPLPE